MTGALPATLPAGTRYVGAGGIEIELLGPSTLRDDGTYSVPARRYVASGRESSAPIENAGFCQSLEFRGAVTLPAVEKLDPYAEHRKKIGDDK